MHCRHSEIHGVWSEHKMSCTDKILYIICHDIWSYCAYSVLGDKVGQRPLGNIPAQQGHSYCGVMSLAPSGALNLPNSGPGLKIVEEAFIRTITEKEWHQKVEANSRVVWQHKVDPWIQHELMFVADMLLLSGAWGMSCYAVEHHTQQPNRLSPPTFCRPISFSHHPYITFVSVHLFSCFECGFPLSTHSLYLLWWGQ